MPGNPGSGIPGPAPARRRSSRAGESGASAVPPARAGPSLRLRRSSLLPPPGPRQPYYGRIVCRCLVLADGFYEWQRLGRRKQPFYIRLRDGRPFG
ncbi:MAG: SOS response-associated peptidase family protein, partial [candidate division NC10 bacterium]|nr:SOS response-associated peptidase family protein [candidate division NC10 bacterium]